MRLILLYTAVGILAFGGLAMGGLAIGFVVPEPRPGLGLGMSVVGFALTAWCVREVIRINGHVLADMYETAVNDPELSIAKWVGADGQEVVFAHTGVFLDRGREWYGFTSGYQNLDQITYEHGILKVKVQYSTGRYDGYHNVALPVPDEHHAAVRAAVDKLRAALNA